MRVLFLALFAGLLTGPLSAYAQIPRERADPNRPVEELFWAPTVIGVASVTNLGGGDLNYTIKHSFGLVSTGIEDLYGLDGAANIRFGLDYGLSDRWSIGFGRSRFEKVYDFRTKVNVLKQTVSGSSPLELAVMGDVGITTDRNGYDFQDRLSYFGSVLLARRVSDRLSLQVAPMVSHFNIAFIERNGAGAIVEEENTHLAVATAMSYQFNEVFALLVEYVPVIGKRSDGTVNAMSVGIDIETGGHVFQLFFTSSGWLTEQHMIARNTDDFFKGDFRWGFNINRVFAL